MSVKLFHFFLRKYVHLCRYLKGVFCIVIAKKRDANQLGVERTGHPVEPERQ